MFNQELANKIDKFLRENLDIIFEFEFNGLLFLWGGALKGFIMDIPIKDFDFVLLTQDEANLLEFINKYNLKYRVNGEHGYSFVYNGLLVGLSSTNDLGGTYSTDFLFYDIHRKQFIPIGMKRTLQKREIIICEYVGYPRYEKRMSLKRRLDVGKKFIQFMNKDNKRVRVVRKNKYYRRMLLGFIKHPSKVMKLFRG